MHDNKESNKIKFLKKIWKSERIANYKFLELTIIRTLKLRICKNTCIL